MGSSHDLPCADTQRLAPAASRPAPPTTPEGWPRLDLHAHPDRSTLAAIAALGRERGVLLGLVEHAGTPENVYPRVLSCDADLRAWTTALAEHGFLKGVQAEWIDWAGCFSTAALATLDYVLTDAMTMPGPDGRRMKLWEPTAVIDPDPDRFMDAYVEWHLAILDGQPIDILANVSWLPARLSPASDTLWTERRIEAVIAAFLRNGVALEISSGFRLPALRFLRLAKAAGVRFCCGSNGRYPGMGILDYGFQAARELGLTPADFWQPGPNGPRAAAGCRPGPR